VTVPDESLFIVYAALSTLMMGALALTLVLLKRRARERKGQQPVPGVQSTPRARPKPPLAAQIAGGVFAAVLVSLAVAAQLKVHDRRGEFERLASSSPPLSFQRGGKRVKVSAPSEVASFFALIEGSAKVGAHHSHPTNEVEVLIGSVTYSIGRDSKEPDELWLRQIAPRATLGDPTLWQLRSKAFSDWMAKVEAQLR
jgi:hypothetical protein